MRLRARAHEAAFLAGAAQYMVLSIGFFQFSRCAGVLHLSNVHRVFTLTCMWFGCPGNWVVVGVHQCFTMHACMLDMFRTVSACRATFTGRPLC